MMYQTAELLEWLGFAPTLLCRQQNPSCRARYPLAVPQRRAFCDVLEGKHT